jgi:hypothetical protein
MVTNNTNYCTDVGGRITSEDIVIEYLPCGAENAHVQQLRFQADVAGGTFKLWVNGNITAAITFSATIATLLTNINNALDALPNLGAGEIEATGTLVTNVTLTAADPAWYTILIYEDALTGNTSSDPNLTTDVTTQGSKLYRISGELSSFNYENSADLVSMTGLSDKYERQKAVLRKMTFSANVYKTDADFVFSIFETAQGIIYVYDTGKVPGRTYFAFWALFDKVSYDYPDHDKVEGEFSGVRNGDMVVPFYTVYA